MDVIKSKALGSSTPLQSPLFYTLVWGTGVHRNMSLYTKVGPNPLKPVWGFCSDEKPYKYVGSKSHHLVL